MANITTVAIAIMKKGRTPTIIITVKLSLSGGSEGSGVVSGIVLDIMLVSEFIGCELETDSEGTISVEKGSGGVVLEGNDSRDVVYVVEGIIGGSVITFLGNVLDSCEPDIEEFVLQETVSCAKI